MDEKTNTEAPYPSLLHAARAAGYREVQSAWLDQETGAHATGTLDIDSLTDPAQRYGNPAGLKVKGWPPEQYVGAHSAHGNVLGTAHDGYAYKVLPAFELGTNVTGIGNRDQGDCNFAVGLTTFIERLAKNAGLVEDPHGTPKPGETGEPKESAAATALAAIVAEATKVRATLPAAGGGKPIHDFRHFLDFVLKTAAGETGAD